MRISLARIKKGGQAPNGRSGACAGARSSVSEAADGVSRRGGGWRGSRAPCRQPWSSGKTTTAAKLAYQARLAGRKPLLGAADTWRAAGSRQLGIWAERIGCESVIGATGADAAAVAYDALDAAVARGCDLVLLDTAGRMHTREPLMRELQKVRAAMDKRLPGAPHHTWIVLDAMLGQNAVVQARQFHDLTPLTGVVATKLDGSSKGGFLFAVRQELDLPILFAGLGEGENDLAPFDPAGYVDALLATGEPA